MKKTRWRTLEQVVKDAGGKQKAAEELGIPRMTLYRWLEGKSQPRGAYARELAAKKIRAC